MQRSSEPGSHGRRSVLGFGLAAAGTVVLSGCGLRIDRGPQYAEPQQSDEVRNAVAAILHSTTAEASRDKKRLAALTQAAGPVWHPSSAPAASPSSEPTRDFARGMADTATRVLDSFDALEGQLTAVLADIAVGAALATHGATATRLDERLSGLVSPEQKTGQATSPAADDQASSPAAPAGDDPLAVFVQTCFQASYGYEQLAIKVAATSPYGKFARKRVDALDIAAMAGNQILHTRGSAVQGDRPAWQLPLTPTDEASAKKLAARLESAIADRTLPLFDAADAKYLAGANLWASAQARSQAGAEQALRFEVSQSRAPGGED